MRALVLALTLVATPAAAADQFDLVCTGDDEPWHYRVDLAKGEWCAGKCETVFRLASVTSGTIVLRSEKPEFRGGDAVENSINRASGEWYYYRSLPKIGFSKTVKGKCELAPFTPMPSRKF